MKRVAAVKTKTVTVKFAPDQYRMIAQRAERSKINVAVWMRLILLQAATRPANNGFLRIKDPDGATI